jgi:CRP-like cAMP-binding protein
MYDAALAAQCNERRAALVRGQYLFSGLTDRQLEEVFRRMAVEEPDAEEWLFFQNDAADRFYLVEEGEVALLRHSAEGEEVIVAIVGPGETFAEEALFEEAPRHSVSCRALTPCSVIGFDAGALAHLLDQPEVLRKLMITLHRRNQILLDEIEQRALQSATDRLLSFLVKETGGGSRGERVALAYPKRTLASRLSIKPETLSRILARLRDCSLLEVDGNEIVLTEPAALRESLECQSCSQRFWGCPGYLARLEAAQRSNLTVLGGEEPAGWATPASE